MAVTQLVYSEASEQILLGLDPDQISLVHLLLKTSDYSLLPEYLVKTANQMGDDFTAYLHLNGVET